MATTLKLLEPDVLPRQLTKEEVEEAIRRGVAGWREAGLRVQEAAERKFHVVDGYPDTTAGFNDYLERHVGVSARRCRQLETAAHIAGLLETEIGTIVPILEESVLRPLAKLREGNRKSPLAEDAVREAWREAVARAPEGKPTARMVAEVVRERIGPVGPIGRNHAKSKSEIARDEFDRLSALDDYMDALVAEFSAEGLGTLAAALANWTRDVERMWRERCQ
jgi:hypothetical protein